MSYMNDRRVAVITGASGGMGRACARLLGSTMNLVLNDVSPAVKNFQAELEADGYTVIASVLGDLGSPQVLDSLEAVLRELGKFDVLVHAGGLAPSAPWRQIMDVNYVSSVKLLNRIRPYVVSGSVAVLIASVAGHMDNSSAEIESVLAEPESPEMLDRLEPLVRNVAGPAGDDALGFISYSISKKKVLDLCMERAADWGSVGARIVSISPGMIYTPMGRHEAETDPSASEAVKGTPLGRWGTAMEIAMAVEFLTSPSAAFITGSDLKVDGGAVGAMTCAQR